ncbi:class I SAM-dependent methyltransferase family protein [Methanosarcinales archaeon]|uniref:tRNA(Phe) (4-demethylwyosine(37)-C(7)) aminocarboxypropyltransferase n=1 Tax=Candidatus Syntropharchaeum caldarium TaxID=1838285 RepID=A0A1F2P977_9EURY|nr:MAG: SAM-dependent methyltransferase [Candidatus Syntrophoarchaeum caldarius]RLG33044.1 MAG: class I SAM-dependent methyltransferase family protein [Methanosarcinales archaeon]
MKKGYMALRKELDGILSPADLDRLPRRWQLIGDIVLVRIDGLEDFWGEIGDAFFKIYPWAKGVAVDCGVHGKLREPDIRVIAGEVSETLHRENHCTFKLDPRKVIFSPGNMNERMRIAALGTDEFVVDMFAGIGYFSIPMAKHAVPEKIIAIELNPVAFEYLLENIRLNHVEKIIEPLAGDCADLTPVGVADRVIMGYLNAEAYLEVGVKAIREEGGILHYHEAVPYHLFPNRPVERIQAACRSLGRGCEIIEAKKVKKFAPGVLHAVIDAAIT